MNIDKTAIDKARAVYYGLFASLFCFSFTEEDYCQCASALDLLGEHAPDEQSELALKNMKRRLKNLGFSAVKDESDRLFFRPDRESIPMTASFICEQRDDGKKRLQMIELLNASPFRRDTENYHELEDHIEFILSFLQRLIVEGLNGNAEAGQIARSVFEQVLNDMIDPFIDKLLSHPDSSFFRQSALALQSFIAFERLYLDVERPKQHDSSRTGARATTYERPESSGCVKMGRDSCV